MVLGWGKAGSVGAPNLLEPCCLLTLLRPGTGALRWQCQDAPERLGHILTLPPLHHRLSECNGPRVGQGWQRRRTKPARTLLLINAAAPGDGRTPVAVSRCTRTPWAHLDTAPSTPSPVGMQWSSGGARLAASAHQTC